jgi:spermidine synthase
MGGGDGAAVRELLKYPEVKKIILADLDPAVTELARTHPVLVDLNDSSLYSEKVEVIHGDAFTYLENTSEYFDLIIADFPDPKTIELSRLYSLELYQLAFRSLRPNGVIISQSGSPFFAKKAFLSIGKTMEEAGFKNIPLHIHMVTLGEWGFQMGLKNAGQKTIDQIERDIKDNLPSNTTWLHPPLVNGLFTFSKGYFEEFDTVFIPVNKMHNPILPELYRAGRWDLY